jgi:hypothetical protein
VSCGERGANGAQDAVLDRLSSCVCTVRNQIGLEAVTGRQASGSEQLVSKPVARCSSEWLVVLPCPGPNERSLQWIQATKLSCMFQLSQISTSGITVAVFWERLRQIILLTFAVVREHYFAVSWMTIFFSTWYYNLIYKTLTTTCHFSLAKRRGVKLYLTDTQKVLSGVSE